MMSYLRAAFCKRRVSARLFPVLVCCCLFAVGCSPTPTNRSCAKALDGVTQLIVVLTPSWQSVPARVLRYERKTIAGKENWQQFDTIITAVVGRAGLGWGNQFEHLQNNDEPVKREGDGRTPAGVFPLGVTFGFSPAPYEGHMTLVPNQQICVDDVRSPHYGEIYARAAIGDKTRGENMGEIALYKNGIVINYPPDRQKKSGSCIFFHIWESAGVGTAGCIAMPERDVVDLQAFGHRGKTAVVIWPETAVQRLASCVPGLQINDPKSVRRQIWKQDHTS